MGVKVVTGICLAAGSLTFRLSRPESGGAGVVSAARVAGVLAPRQWTCLALNVAERVQRRTMHIQVTT